MTSISGWQWVWATLGGLLFFLVFSAGYGLFVYLKPERFVSVFTPADLGYEFEEVALTTADGLKLAAWYIPAAKSTTKAVLLLHGYPADKGDILSSMIFLQEDYNLLFLDFRYFGQSEGKYSTIGIKEVEDVLAGVEFLKDRDMEKIGVYGFSMGGAAALMSLPATDQIQAVVSETSYASLALMAQEVWRQVPGLNSLIAAVMGSAAKLFLQINITQQSPLAAVQATSAPILFIHSRDDEVIPFRHAELLRQAAAGNPRAEFWFRESLGHGYLGSEEYQRRVRDFFQKHL